jgi:hypothetical protein
MTVNEIQTFGAMVEGVELVSNLITRYAIFENLYLYETSTVKEQLTESVIRLYATILLYLSKASRYYDRKTSGVSKTVLHFMGELTLLLPRALCKKYHTDG